MKPIENTISTDLDRYLAGSAANDIPSTANYVERGAALVTPHALVGLRALRGPLYAKIATLTEESRLRTRLETLAVFFDEWVADRTTPTPAVREAAFALLYFLKGFDRIPDSVPEIGFLDDALIVEHVLQNHGAAFRAHSLRRGRVWPVEL